MATLSQLVTRWRDKLDDAVDNYLWSNDELTEYGNRIMNSICREVGLIEDSTTADICTIDIAVDDAVISVSNRITYIKSAKLSSHTKPLARTTKDWMDENISDWQNESSSTVTKIITKGIGRDIIRLYPPSDTIDTLNLTVYRLPEADLVWDTDQAEIPEFPEEYHHLLSHGVCWLAYSKQDTDAYDKKAIDRFFNLYRQDVEEIKVSELKKDYMNFSVQPLLGNM